VTLPDPRSVRIARARTSVSWVFAVSGYLMANWLARLPAVRDALDVTAGRLGTILLALSAGSVLAMPLSGPVVHRLSPARTVFVCAGLSTASMVVVGVAGSGRLGGIVLLAPALFGYGVGVGMWDVAMNVEGAEVERGIERAIMPWFHAAFSLGTVAGALTGAAAAAAGVPVPLHLAAVSLAVFAVIASSVRHFLPVSEHARHTPDRPDDARSAGSGALAAWREPRTLMVGLLALGMAMAEGSANDWLALGLVDGYGMTHAVGAIGLGVFLIAMTGCRLAGPMLLARFGRVRVLRGGAVLVLAGVLLYVGAARLVDPGAGSSGANALPLALAAVAAIAWGFGAALGFPVAMSAAADDPVRSAARVSVVSSIGYLAFLAGPPLLGMLADRVGIVQAMLGVSAAVALSLLCAGAARATDAGRAAPG
jgi:fucose permease